MGQYVALLRGINVGGKNLIPMARLKACFEGLGFEQVATYIQSGNVLFEAAGSDGVKLTRQIEKALAKTFSYRASVVLRSRKQMQETVRRAPRGFGSQPDKYRYDVLFLKAPLTAANALKIVAAQGVREGVDEVWPGPGALYFRRLVARATQSKLSRVVSLPIYQQMTIRNWNTTRRLGGMGA
jgi:uncharacterized protein (DUF1697 family)